MLVLERKRGQSIKIGEDVVIVFTKIGKNSVRVAIEAPRSVLVYRRELGEWVAAAKPANAIEAAKFSAHDGSCDDRWTDDDCKSPKPCDCNPGTSAKIEELARRVESGESLFCELDASGRLYSLADIAAWCDRDDEKKEKS